MKKLFGILLVLALVLSFSLVATNPVAAQTTWYVVEGGAGAQDGTSWADAFATIQEAIDAADSGDIIEVAAGTYTESLKIDRSITIIGPNKDVSPNTDTRVDEAIITNPGGIVFDIQESGIDLTINGVTVSDVGTFLKDNFELNINYNISHNIFKDGTSWESFYFRTQVLSLIFHDNYLTCDQGSYVYIRMYHTHHGPNSIMITNNVWENHESLALNLNYVVGEISGNVFSGDEKNQWGIVLATPGNDIKIKNNAFENLHGIGLYIFGNFRGSAEVTGNTFVNSQQRGVTVLESAELGNVIVRFNCFRGNAIFGIDNWAAESLDAVFNWWADVNGPTHVTNPAGGGDEVYGNVDFYPWLTGFDYTGGTSFTETDDVVLVATLSSFDNGGAGGPVDFYVNGNHVGSSLTDVDGVAELNIGTLAAGTYEVMARATACLEITAEIEVRELPPAHVVGWEGQPINTAAVVAPWIALLAGLAAGAGLLALRRRQTQI